VQVGVAASGEAVVVWTDDAAVWAAVAPPDAAFGPSQRLGTLPKPPAFDPDVSPAALNLLSPPRPALAVAPDGRALALFESSTGPRVAERPPGAGFGPAGVLPGVADRPDQLAAAVNPDGGAILAWRVAEGGAVRSAARAAPGPFAAATTIASPPDTSELWLLDPPPRFTEIESETPPLYGGGGDLSVRLTADGRALLAWVGPRAGAGGAWIAPFAASLPLAGGHLDLQTLGGPLRHAGVATPVLLAGGTPAVAWQDNGEYSRLHVAIEGAAAAADPVAPRVRVTPSARRALHSDDGLPLVVSCGAACDVRASVLGEPGAEGTLSLAEAGRASLFISPARRPIAPAHAGPVRVRVSYGAPGARHPRVVTLRLTLRRVPTPPLPRAVGLEAHRHGDSIEVSWRTAAPLREAAFAIVATVRRGTRAPVASGSVGVSGPAAVQRFHATLRHAAKARWVAVYGGNVITSTAPHATVRVS
jgi:hypothetical protein